MAKKIAKLIRDKMPEIIEQEGHCFSSYVCDEQEYRKRLRENLWESVAEFLGDDATQELVDIVEIAYALAALKGVSRDEFEAMRRAAVTEQGAFEKRIVAEFNQESCC